MVSSQLPACKGSSNCCVLGGGPGAARSTPFSSKVRSPDFTETLNFKMWARKEKKNEMTYHVGHDRMESRWQQTVDTHLFSNRLETCAW